MCVFISRSSPNVLSFFDSLSIFFTVPSSDSLTLRGLDLSGCFTPNVGWILLHLPQWLDPHCRWSWTMSRHGFFCFLSRQNCSLVCHISPVFLLFAVSPDSHIDFRPVGHFLRGWVSNLSHYQCQWALRQSFSPFLHNWSSLLNMMGCNLNLIKECLHCLVNLCHNPLAQEGLSTLFVDTVFCVCDSTHRLWLTVIAKPMNIFPILEQVDYVGF